MSQPTGKAQGPALRLLEALPALVQASAGSEGWRHAGALLEAAGALLRRRDAWHGGDAAERALASLDRAHVQSWLSVLDDRPVHEALARARQHAAEAALCEDPEEAALHAAEALAGLTIRDRLASQAAALAHWEQRQVAGSLPLMAGLQTRLAALDGVHRPHARTLVGLNAQRRAELALLDAPARAEAWWFGARVACDGLWSALSGDLRASEAHLEACVDCLSDLEDGTAVIAASRPEHLDAESLWALEFDEAPRGERVRWAAHAAECEPCAELLQAMQEGDAAILAAEELEEDGEDSAASGRGLASPEPPAMARARRPERSQLASHEAFRVMLLRDTGSLRLLVQPSRPGAVTAASASLLGAPHPLRARPTPEGLEFALGEASSLARRTIQLQLTLEGGLRFSRDFAL